jgi:hypothetical protein
MWSDDERRRRMTDMDWIPATIMALGVAIPSIVGSVLSIRAANRAGVKASEANDNAIKANDNAIKAKAQSEETHVAINSRMDEMLKLTRTEAEAKATLAEKDAEVGRQREATALKEGTPDAVVELARVQAKLLLDNAAIAAAKILYDAKFARKNLEAPVQVEIIQGAGVDDPLKVVTDTEATEKKKDKGE